ncbi:single-stranded-DNA-specific exonuclease RecJ [Selenomonas sp. F0473]|uniref:single-stranded-DNA-specific exonuclease RecJ n=2 Tax=Selenomonas sp. F0473 TaxID=999423 RepID=UPI00029E652D|nr:single-stranded-DNA-specific exonuclease RecJ [Selenomonas sp. F0473]EKU71510.1 single-stranded-DNA-specific exonuclease RecJ [Selenomonas sp. F0473]
MLKEWLVHEASAEAEQFAREIGIAPVVGQILWRRGIRTRAAANDFLHPEEAPFHDPFLMADMEPAVDRILRAIAGREPIVVYGDYDVDGMTSTVILTKNIRALGGDVSYYIPNRFTEGYGINLPALEELHAAGCVLLVTVDCGIASVDPVAAMRGEMDIIVTDHHLPGAQLPPAHAVLNPHRTGCAYPEKELAGVGVAFKLCQALWRRHTQRSYEDDLDIVALGTVADLVPLVGENRKIVRHGLRVMTEGPCVGMRALIAAAGLEDKTINTGHVGFQLAPRLNAAGRLETARRGVELLSSELPAEAERIAEALNALNTERRDLEWEILTAARQELADFTPDMPAIVVAGEDWNAGVIGIVASRLVDIYYRPSIVLTRQDDVYKGSCRSIAGLHMYEALAACRDTLIQFGGHAMAAGLSLLPERLPEFRTAFSDYVRTHLTPADFMPKVEIMALVPPTDWTVPLIEELALMEPYGMGNPRPVFGARDIRPQSAAAIGGEGKHLRLELGSDAGRVAVLYWNHGDLAAVLAEESVDIAYIPNINEWQGVTSVQCTADSLRPAACELVFPERELLKRIYRRLHAMQSPTGAVPYELPALTCRLRSLEGHISQYTVARAMDIFHELGLLEPLPDGTWKLIPSRRKMELTEAPTYRRYKERKEDEGHVK